MEKPRNHHAGDGGARFAGGKQEQGDEGKQAKHGHPFQEHGGKAELGPRVGKDAKVACWD